MQYFQAKQYVEQLISKDNREFSHKTFSDFGGWKEWQTAFRGKLSSAMGLNQINKETANLPLSPRLVERVELPNYSREKLYVTTEQGIEIPFYLLLPKDSKGPLPLVLTPHGHGRRGKEVYIGNFEDDEEKEQALSGDRDIALQAVSQGYAVIAMDVRGFWEMAREEDLLAGKDGYSCDDLQKKALMFGLTLIGQRVHDMGRLIDYASTRPEIDPSRIAITGNSGGGTVSLFTAALDDRIRVCVSGSYFCTFEASILSIFHCPCNYIPGLMNLGEMYDIAGLVAPRPFLAVNGEYDDIFPADATRDAFSHLTSIYTAMGAADHCELFMGEGGHRYYKEPVWPFIGKHL